MQRIHIATAITRGYLLPLAVLLESIRQTQRPDVEIVLHLLHRNLEDTDLQRLSTLVEINPIRVSERLSNQCVLDPSFPAEASFPLILAELLPSDLEHVLFLDADMIVLADLSALWEMPMGDQVLLAVQDGAVPFCSSRRGVKEWKALGIPQDAAYFNGGVLLINLPMWRALDVSNHAQAYLKRNLGKLDFIHQEVFNAVLWDKRTIIDERWNLLASQAGRIYDRYRSDAWKNPGIVHFAGQMKPWLFPVGGPFYKDYQRMMERVLYLFPKSASGMKGWVKSSYDRSVRNLVYPLETYLWKKRWF